MAAKSSGQVVLLPGRYYVVDTLASSRARALLAGPFSSALDAELERRLLNIAGDCRVYRCNSDRSLTPVPL